MRAIQAAFSVMTPLLLLAPPPLPCSCCMARPAPPPLLPWTAPPASTVQQHCQQVDTFTGWWCLRNLSHPSCRGQPLLQAQYLDIDSIKTILILQR